MNNVEAIPLIAINIFKTSLPDVNNQKLVQEITSSDGALAEHYLKDKNHTYYEDQRYPFGKEEAESLIKKLTTAVSSILNKEMILEEIWTLTLQKGQSVAWHSHKSNTHLHPQDYFSIAYYANAPENSAELIFTTTACNTLEQSYTLSPEAGGLVVFNSFIPHMTSRHLSDEPRIVISANFSPKYPNSTPTQDWTAYSRPQWNEYSQTIDGYYKAFSVDVHTPFGEETYTLGLNSDSTGEILFAKSTQKISNYAITDTSFSAEVQTDVPMTTTVSINFSIDTDTNNINGIAKFGQFMECKISGKQIK